MGHSGIRIDTAAGGSAAACIALMGGLTIDQLRWIYSALPMVELKGFKWNSDAVPFSDKDESTHLWSELNENCTTEEILLVGPADKSDIGYVFLMEHVLTGGFERPRAYYEYRNMAEMDTYLASHPNSIAFWPFYNLLDPDYAERASNIFPVPIKGSRGGYVMPSTQSFEDHDYPLLRRVDLAINNEPANMEIVRPFLEFALSHEGDHAIMDAGFWPIRIWEKNAMLSRISSSLVASNAEEIRHWCGPADGMVDIAGNTDVKPVAHLWSLLYNLACPVRISMQATNSGDAANRLCVNDIDIALMARDWTDEEAMHLNTKFLHECYTKNVAISSVEVEVAKDGLALVAAKGSAAANCVVVMGGLKRDQLRWIFSNYSEQELNKSGWDPASLKMSDGVPGTHLWSELDPRCEPEEIALAGDFPGGDAFITLSETVLPEYNQGESVAMGRKSGYFAEHPLEVFVYLLKNTGGLGVVPFNHYYRNQEIFSAAPIQGLGGSFVTPSRETIADGSYPMVRSLTMSLLNNPTSLQHTIPLLKFGYAHPEYFDNTGYIPIDGAALEDMLQRLDGAPYVVDKSVAVKQDDDFEMFDSIDFVVGFAGACVVFILVVGFLFWYTCVRRDG